MSDTRLVPDLTVEQIQRYDKRVPRYTSYPTVPNWDSEQYGPDNYINHLQKISEKNDPLSLYIHLPFCIRRCRFCACNVLITKREDRPKRYLKYLKMEISKVSSYLNDREDVIQLHLGGGTPTHLNPDQMNDLFIHLKSEFKILSDAELSIEVHPSVTSNEHIDVLRDHDFNRLSMGVQDFDQKVQENLNRYQTYDETVSLIDHARSVGFESINVDLIYGLPYQTNEGFMNTIEQVKTFLPDRIALYSYAHFPTIFPHHGSIPLDVIPSGPGKLQLFLNARRKFLEFDYEQIGFDHFTRKEDDLWSSYQEKTLRRNFMGYTTKAGTDLVAFGYSSISELSNSYAQNSKDMQEYEDFIEKYGVATSKGHSMSERDKLRKQVIMDILCLGQINLDSLDDYDQVLKQEVIDIAEKRMPEFEEIDFVKKINQGWELTPKGNIFGRIVSSNFDAYLDASSHLYSKAV